MVIEAYGKDLHRKIQHKRTICVGTIWGTIDKFIEFSKVMWKQLDSEWSLKHKVIEQAVANFIIYHDKMLNDCLVKSKNKEGPIMAIGLTKKKDIYLDLNDNILNKKGEVAAIIHQYKKSPKFSKKF